MASSPPRAGWLQRLARRKREPVAFALSGGGPLGALQVGQLRALFENGIVPSLVVGTSVGALNASFLAYDPTFDGVERLERIWLGLTEGDLFPGGRFRATWARMLVRGNKVFENSGIRKLVETRLGNARIEEARIRLGIVATDLETGAERVFTSGDVLKPLLASTAMPGVFPPVEIDNRLYIDGGVANNVPIAPAVRLGARTVYVMDSTSAHHQRRPLQRPMDYLLHSFTLSRAQRMDVERELYEKRVRLVLLPAGHLDFFVPFASMDSTARLVEHGYSETTRFLSGEMPARTEAAGGGLEAIAPAE
jgi:NTE family protein